MTDLLEELLRAQIDWDATPESKYIFGAVFREQIVKLRLNDFPDEPICTIIIDNQETNVEEIPEGWSLPAHRKNRNPNP